MARVLGVLSLIQSRGRWNAKVIADELGVSERTVYRDLEVLEFAGVPWYFDEAEFCYRLRSDIRFLMLALTDEEAWAEVIATALSKAPSLTPGAGATPTTRKLAATSKPATQQLLADAAKLVEVFSLQLADHSRHQEAIKTVQVALLNTKRISGVYESPHESVPRNSLSTRSVFASSRRPGTSLAASIARQRRRRYAWLASRRCGCWTSPRIYLTSLI